MGTRVIEDVAALHGIDLCIPEQHHKWQRPKRLEDSVTLESTGSRESLSTSQSLKHSIYYPVLDHILAELDRRFSKVNLEHMKVLQACVPSSSSFLDVSHHLHHFMT